MKSYSKYLIILSAGLMILICLQPCFAEEPQEDIWADEPEFKHRELTPERIERIISHIAERDPKKAEELLQLQQEGPEKFIAELRKIMHHQFGQRHKRHRKDRDSRKIKPEEGPPPMFDMMGGGGHSGKRAKERCERAMKMHQKHTEYLEWLQENYPDEANGLADIRDEKPELYMKRLQRSLRKYGRIVRASKENPQLAEILKKDLVLKGQRNALLKEIKTTIDKKKTKALTKELETVVSSRFDLIVERKQAEYEQLNKRLEELKEQVQKSQAQIEKWKDSKFKDENVKSRVDKLVSKAEQFSWD